MPAKKVYLGGKGVTKRISIGGDSQVSLQTMWKEPIDDLVSDSQKVEKILQKMSQLGQLGCDIIRFAVPDLPSAQGLCLLAQNTSIPLVADIHFDYKLALECIKGNVAAIRINPGNIGSVENTRAVVQACRDNGLAIRIGINSGSLPKDLQESIAEGKITRAHGLCETAVREAQIFEE